MFATFECGDDLVEALRRRAAYVGLSYGMLEHLSGMSDGACSKYLGPRQAKRLTTASLTRLAAALGLKVALVVDDELTRKMKRHWGQRDVAKVRCRAIASAVSTSASSPAPSR